MMKFKLTEKNYQTENYEADFKWNGIPLKAIIYLQYHTFLKYWHLSYKIGYRGNMVTPTIKYIDNSFGSEYEKLNRTKLREIAKQWMKEAKSSDVEKLDKFYQNEIIKR